MFSRSCSGWSTFTWCAGNPALCHRCIDARVTQVEVRYEDVQQSFRAMDSVLKILDILRRGIPSAVGRLVVGAVYWLRQPSVDFSVQYLDLP